MPGKFFLALNSNARKVFLAYKLCSRKVLFSTPGIPTQARHQKLKGQESFIGI
jgi:hypothetical protein